MRVTASGYQSTTPDGVGLHTSIPVVVRRVRFVQVAGGNAAVEVLATISDAEDATESVTFHMTHQQALAADIIERVR